jgi:hypothetical protein
MIYEIRKKNNIATTFYAGNHKIVLQYENKLINSKYNCMIHLNFQVSFSHIFGLLQTYILYAIQMIWQK